MNAFEATLQKVNHEIFDNIKTNFQGLDAIYKKFNKYTEKVIHTLQLCQETGEDPKINLENWDQSDEDDDCVFSESENTVPKTEAKAHVDDHQDQDSIRLTRSKRNAFKQATTSIQEQSAQTLNAKLRRPSTKKSSQDTAENYTVKAEKQSFGNEAETVPPPKKRGRRKKAQLLQIKEEELEEDSLQIKQVKQEQPDEEWDTKMDYTEVEVQEPPKNESNEKKETEVYIIDCTMEKTAVGSMDKNLVKITSKDEDTDREKKNTKSSDDAPETTIMDLTIVVDKPKCVKNVNDMITTEKKGNRAIKPKQKNYDQTPRSNATTRSQTKSNEVVDKSTATGTKKKVKETIKSCTPKQKRFIPKATSTGIKQINVASVANPSPSLLMVSSSSSALKASRDKFRERERKRLEKEEDVRKREALIQAEIEEKKREREENRRIRDKLEQDRLQAKPREDKIKQRQMAGLPRKDEEVKKIEAMSQVPIYMKTEPPRLPTQDCYDSDEEGYDAKRAKQPNWASFRNLYGRLKIMGSAGESVKNTFFSVQAQTPDLQEIFEVIKPIKLKRTSSACWTKLPRFTMVPGFKMHEELSEDEN